MKNENPWWQGAVIYQIYPRSFMDSNHDGIGDLAGIISKLDYVAKLGVDAIWIAPFFKSPMRDYGYDVSDYREVDPMFGTLDDFRRLLARAHELDLKVLVDQVLSHTSDRHEWFEQSRVSADNPKSDWYVWADPRPDGGPPNNWLSIFGGSAWTFDSRRCQYYLHNFLASQPDLNFHCPAVRRAQLDNMRFWLDFGVDGFRLDTVNFYFHDASLRDNPPLPPGDDKTLGAPASNPYSWQRHLHDISQPENLDFLRDLRSLAEEYEGITTVGEIGDDNPLQRLAEYTADGDKLHMAYTFDLLNEPSSASYIRQVIQRFEQLGRNAWPCWALSNHDVMRSATRWGRGTDPIAYPKVSVALLLSLRGSACIYQGEELGLPESDVPFESIRDPYGKALWPMFKGRDGCRTPIPWNDNARHGGFTDGQPWLPVDKHHIELAVNRQTDDENSVLNGVRRMLAFRKAHPALIDGDLELVDVGEDVLGFVRRTPDEAIFCLFNLTAQDRTVTISEHGSPLGGAGFREYIPANNGSLTLPAYQAAYLLLDCVPA